MHTSRFCIVALACAAFASSTALASDGVVEINQAKALAGSVTPGDAPGFPVTINQTGSYRLTGDLQVPANLDGVVITSPFVTLDLGGFSLAGGGCTLGAGPSGISAGGGTSTIVVRNGTVRSWMHGIDLRNAQSSRVEDLAAEGNCGRGFRTGFASIVANSTARQNNVGIQVGISSRVVDSVADFNTTAGIEASNDSLITGCVVTGNGLGISAGTGVGASGNTLSRNGIGILSGGQGLFVHNVIAGNSAYGISGQQSDGVGANAFNNNTTGYLNAGTAVHCNAVNGVAICP